MLCSSVIADSIKNIGLTNRGSGCMSFQLVVEILIINPTYVNSLRSIVYTTYLASSFYRFVGKNHICKVYFLQVFDILDTNLARNGPI